MVASAQNLTNLSEKAVRAARASPGKTAALTGLVLIMIVAWIRVLIGGHPSPNPAQGATISAAHAAVVAEDSTEFRYPAETEQGPSIQSWARQQAGPLSRNPFIIPMDYYPSDMVRTDDSPSSSSYWNLLAKSLSARADQQEQRQILVDNVLLAAEGLKLSSTIMGATPGALVNGQLVNEGSEIAGFHVLKIEPRQIIVEREGVKLAVMMN
jgi:hypothetical protein